MTVRKKQRYLSSVMAVWMTAGILFMSGCKMTDTANDTSTGDAETEEASTAIHIEPDISSIESEVETGTVDQTDVTDATVFNVDIDSQTVLSFTVSGLTGDPDYALKATLNKTNGIHSVTDYNLGDSFYSDIRPSCAPFIVTDGGYSFSTQPITNGMDNGQIVVYNDSDGSIAGHIKIPSQIGSNDWYVFELNGELYLEADFYDYEYDTHLTDCSYYRIDPVTWSVCGEVEPFGGDRLYVANECKIPDGECLVIADKHDIYNTAYLYIYTDGNAVPEVIDITGILGQSEIYVNYIAYCGDSTLAIKSYSYNYGSEELSALINYGQKADDLGFISEAFPAEARTAYYAITDSNCDTYFFDDNGVIKLDTETLEFSPYLSYADVDLDYEDLYYSRPESVNSDGSIILTHYDLEEFTSNQISSLISPTGDINDPRTAVNILVYGYADDFIIGMIDQYNDTSSEYRGRMCIVYPLASYSSSNIVYTDPTTGPAGDVYYFNEYESTLEASAHVISILKGDSDVDIFLSNGFQPEFWREDVFEDVRDVMNDYEEDHPDELFYNVIDAAEYNGALYQIPLAFYLPGVITMEEITQGTLDSFGIDGNVTQGNINVVTTDINGYSQIIENVLGTDPMAIINTDPDYLNELISADYTDLIGEDPGTIDTDKLEEMISCVSEMRRMYGAEWSDNSQYSSIMSIDELIWNGMGGVEDIRSFIPIPSSDGKVIAGSYLSEAIVSGTSVPDGARDFLLAMLGQEPQESTLYMGMLTINRAAFRSAEQVYIDFYISAEEIETSMEIVETLADMVSGTYYIDAALRSAVINAANYDLDAEPTDLADLISENYQS